MAPATAEAPPSTAQRFMPGMFSLSELFPSPLNPRKKFTPESLADLQANIQRRAEVIVPLILRTATPAMLKRAGVKDRNFEIIDGERRYRGANGAGNIDQVPAIVRDDLTDGEVIEMMLLTSIQKQELTPLEEAGGFKALIDSNKSIYSVAYIADRISRTERYVFDRMKLLALIPILKKLLEADRILVGHAELLAKLKPEDQERALYVDVGRQVDAGLWENEDTRLELDDEDREDPSPKNLYRGLKPVTVKELESWIAHHVRFDVEHMAAAAPLEFGEMAKEIEAAKAEPGRGLKVIAITHEYRVDDDAKDPNERTYAQQSWERADGQEKSKTCEHSVLGTFVAGPGYGTTLRVCVNRDKCTVHFGNVIKAREKNQKLRQQGKGGQAAQREQKAREAEDRKREAEAAERQQMEKLLPKAEEAVRAHISQLPFKKVFAVVAAQYAKGAKNPEQLVRALAVSTAIDNTHYMAYFELDTKRFGFDIKAWFADQKKSATSTSAPAKAAKKAKKR